jgi:outer membrane usher protein
MTIPLTLLRRRAPARQHLVHLFVAGYSSATLAETNPYPSVRAVEFQSGFLHQSTDHAPGAGQHALRALTQLHDVGPGRYRVDIEVNRTAFGQHELDLSQSPDGKRLVPCLSAELLGQMGVRLDSIAEPELLKTSCVDLLALTPGAQIAFDGSQLLLTLSIPQIALRRDVRGHIDPEHWDHGINAAFVSYQVSAQQGSSRYRGRQNSDDLYLNSGLNLGPWRLRSNQSLRQNQDGKREWARAYTYAQRDLPGTHANLTVGESFTNGDVFRSLPIKGALIGSDLGMLPDVLQGYAPIIRGVAQTRAKLEIFQNGYPLYSTYVSPGPYEIDDLSINGGSGELDIVLTEADGQVRRFTQSFATINNLLREGVWRYSAALGRYNGAQNLDDPLLWQGTLAMGTAWDFTLYGGLMASDYYRAGSLGVARNLGQFGALALDVTQSSADIGTLDARHLQGVSYALKYGKSFASNTNLRFAGYRYSTEGYRDFDEAVRQRNHDSQWYGSRRSRLEASIYQNIGKGSSLSLTLSQQDYWHSSNTQRQYQLGANTRFKDVTFNVFASQSLNNARDNDRQIGLSMSMPLDFGHSAYATFDTQKSGDHINQRATLSGNSDHSRLNYQASLGSDNDRHQSAALSVGYQAPFGSVGAGVTQGNNYRNVSLNASGAVLMHAGGVETGPYLGETTALVQVPGIAGVGLLNAAGVETNERGYVLAPNLRPYRTNQLVLQTDQLGPEVEIENGTTQVIPTRGAVVKATFAARTVTRLLITGHTVQGQPLPFGAQLSDEKGVAVGIVGQAGQVLLSTSAEPQVLNVSWGERIEPQCQLHIDPQQMEQTQGYRMQELTCR